MRDRKSYTTVIVTVTALVVIGAVVVTYKRQRAKAPAPCSPCEHVSLPFDDITTVSAPGKVLITGGYLVLEKPNAGIVLATTARFQCRSSWKKRDQAATDQPRIIVDQSKVRMLDRYGFIFDPDSTPPPGALVVIVHSPQLQLTYKYIVTWSKNAGGLATITQPPKQPTNHFVEHTLTLTLTYLGAKCCGVDTLNGRELRITLAADNDFYSQTKHLLAKGVECSRAELAKLPQHMPCPKEGGKVVVSKTGLGSSAALVTSLVGCLLSTFKAVQLPEPTVSGAISKSEESGLRIVHNLAQICHAAAQGKIGSGFDVSAAVYGSHIYTRFTANIITPALNVTSTADIRSLRYCVCGEPGDWDSKREPSPLPTSFRLMMGDVCGGSSTTSLVRAVQFWREASSTRSAAASIWNALSSANEAARAALQDLKDLEEKDTDAGVVGSKFSKTCESMAGQTSVVWSAFSDGTAFDIAAEAFAKCRRLLREMGEAAGVPIEPKQQTRLLDATAALPGVLCCGVPGAGGIDAIFAIVVHPSAMERVEKLWTAWGSRDDAGGVTVCPLLLDATGSAPGDGLTCEIR